MYSIPRVLANLFRIAKWISSVHHWNDNESDSAIPMGTPHPHARKQDAFRVNHVDNLSSEPMVNEPEKKSKSKHRQLFINI